MTSPIDQAVASIKAGNTQTGFEILRSFLEENPDSEKAWWVMSGLVPAERRPHCLKQVLRINPDNEMAREALAKFQSPPVKSNQEKSPSARKPSPLTRDAPSTPIPSQQPPPESQPAAPSREQVQKAYGLRSWLYTRGSQVHLVLVSESSLILAIIPPKQLSEVKSAVQHGKLPEHLFQDQRIMLLNQITAAKQENSKLKLYYQQEGEGRVTVLDTGDASETNEILLALLDSLGSDFTLRPSSRMNGALIISLVLTLGAVVVAILAYVSARRIAANQPAPLGILQSPPLISLFETLGPGVVGLAGGLLVLISLGISSWLLISRTAVTVLTRKT